MYDIGKIMEKFGIPGRDLHELPSSTKTFPDGANYRIEISGIERPMSFEVMLDEMQKLKVPVHRAVCVVMGTHLLTFDELRQMACLSRQGKIEMLVLPAPTRSFDTGRLIATSEGYVCGLRTRGSDMLKIVISEIFRCLDAGIRGFLVVDEGLLWLLNEMRRDGDIPNEVTFKVSVFAGHGTAASAKVLQKLGANTFNPLADLTVPMLASIRSAVDIPIDVYVSLVDSMGGINRFWEAAEIARVCSPCYFKFEPGPSEGALYKPYVDDSVIANLAREKLKMAKIVIELIERINPTLKTSKPGPSDLVLAKAD